MKLLTPALMLTLFTAPIHADVLTTKTLTELNKIHSVTVSPDATKLVYGLKDPVSGANHLWLKDLSTTSTDKQLTSSSASEHNIVWSANSADLMFLSGRSGSSQIWKLSLSGGEAIQVTDFPLDVDEFKVSGNGKTFLLSFDVKFDCDTMQCTVDFIKQQSEVKHSAATYSQLPVRHWDEWEDQLVRHLFVADVTTNEKVSAARDLMSGWNTDAPARPFSGMEEVSISNEGDLVYFSAKSPAKDQAWTTNFDIFEVKVTDNTITNITEDNKAWDSQPVLSADGRHLAYLAMKTPGYEADKFSIMLRDNRSGSVKEVAPLWDRSASSVMFSKDGRSLIAVAQDLGQRSIVEISTGFGDIKKIVSDGSVGNVNVTSQNVIYTRHSLAGPADIFSTSLDGHTTKQLTEVNKEKLSQVKLSEFAQFQFKGWNDETVYGYWVKPANYEEGKQYPVAFLVHGGPQGSFGNMFHFRWNAQLWAAQGFAVVMVDFHGSTGYGQAFTDSINKDWGGKPLEDLQKGLAAVAKQQPWIDADNACALGGSYGGYMMNWIAGNWNDGFKCLVNHAGLFDMPSFYQTTEELWFPEYDFGGTLWDTPETYDAANPANHVENWQTPMLVIHGLKDYRVPYGQGLGAFTTLQRKGIDSELLIFPEENHWILNSDNLIHWYDRVFTWMNKYTKQ